tara:strand:+ start:1494 stop:2714 length:1221 start_codon:yes stop_codon:yes gene_type:complete
MKKTTKIINDPIYGFIRISNKIILDLIDHKYFQRLRRISQLGLSYLVYPGANHTRFQHAIGSMFLTQKALTTLRLKGHIITDEEYEGTSIAVLLHDIGHGPFSHALENSIADKISHEKMSVLFMKKLNLEFDKKLSIAIKIFQNKYPKKFLHQLVSSQLDMDRIDYLNRDSFYSGVQEGVVGADRIINMLNVVNDELVIESKGIYSVEKFLVARRLMYWQVYLHKTVISAENMLIKVLKRAKKLTQKGESIFAPTSLKFFLNSNNNLINFKKNEKIFNAFVNLDDTDIVTSIKEWQYNKDKVLSLLSRKIINRNLLKIKLSDKPFDLNMIFKLQKNIMEKFSLNLEESKYLIFSDYISNSAYEKNNTSIKVLFKNGSTKDILLASDQLNLQALSNKVVKYFLCFSE